jgi:large subunit ribosomal protein L10
VEGKAIAPDQVTRLAHLPSKVELLGQLGGALQAPLAGLVGAMNGLLTMMVGALEALKDQRASGAAS